MIKIYIFPIEIKNVKHKPKNEKIMQRENLFTSYDVKHIIAMILAAHKQPKEAIHLSFLVKINDSQILPFQFLIFLELMEIPLSFSLRESTLKMEESFTRSHIEIRRGK